MTYFFKEGKTFVTRGGEGGKNVKKKFTYFMAHFRTGRERAGTLAGQDKNSAGALAGSVIWSG